jgi:hypothetical protein
MVLRQGRGPALAYGLQFIEEAKAEDFVQAAIERASVLWRRRRGA